ncbi:FecR family protein [Sphingomonas azotifigens]|uniref:FecR family protein n=1 Tax=Sphingomonas azotifigens TaxID=330920 RepID=UPI000A0677A6|nr:DUF4880 domain-containing protein [Sphingomonas azotifigens]
MSEPQDQDPIEAEAAAWLAALDCGRADPAAFEAWRAADPAHAIAFIRLNQAWRGLDRFARTAAKPGAPEAPVSEEVEVPVRPARRRLLQAAGLGAVAAGAGVALSLQRAAAHTVETAVGERQRFYVDERACFDLNTASRLRWWRSGQGLEVALERGQLRLDLAPGAPACTVHAGPATLQLGSGAFDLRLLAPERVDVVAISGEAELLARKGGAGAVRLTRRHAVSVSAEAPAIPRPVAEDALRARSAWREGELIFEGQTLAEAVAEYNRYLRTPMVLGDAEAGRLRLGGRFLTSDPSEFLQALALNFGLRAEHRPDRILLYRERTAP